MIRKSLFVTALFLSSITVSIEAKEFRLPEAKPTIEIKKMEVYKPPVSLNRNSTTPLTKRDVRLYTKIFNHQDAEKWDKSGKLIAQITNPVLIDYVLATQNKQVSAKKTSKVQGTLSDLRYFAHGSKYISEKYRGKQRYEVKKLRKKIDEYLSRSAVTSALSYFNRHKTQAYIDPIDKAQILAEIASHYLYLKHYDKARSTALKAIKVSDKAPLAGWVMGLTAWMRDDMVEATKYFTLAANAPYASPWMTSAASYWGARAATRGKLFPQVSPLLAKAVKNQRTFYGLIATKALGYGYDFNWTMPEYSAQHEVTLRTHPAGARALAFIMLDKMNLAEQELFSIPVKSTPKMAEAAIALAHHYNLAGYAMRFSSAVQNPAGGYYDAGLFPISNWTKNVKQADMAMLNAFIRQESRFKTQAHNPTGATGLMQIMPETAAFITNNGTYKTDEGKDKLSTPNTNVKIGAQYLNHLLGLKPVDNDMFGLAIAYNAGPGKLGRWKTDLKIDDPLLFIELIPSSETRAFVERVMTNYWIYQMQLGAEPKTLTAVAQGDWPKVD